jgi:hypothetical protein
MGKKCEPQECLFLDLTPNIFGNSEIGHGIHDSVQGGYNLFATNNRMSFEEAHGEKSHKKKTNLDEDGLRQSIQEKRSVECDPA